MSAITIIRDQMKCNP